MASGMDYLVSRVAVDSSPLFVGLQSFHERAALFSLESSLVLLAQHHLLLVSNLERLLSIHVIL